jgi:hypothetical protein
MGEVMEVGQVAVKLAEIQGAVDTFAAKTGGDLALLKQSMDQVNARMTARDQAVDKEFEDRDKLIEKQGKRITNLEIRVYMAVGAVGSLGWVVPHVWR